MKFKSKIGDSINLNRDDLRDIANKVYNDNASLDELVEELIGNKLDGSNSKYILEERVKYYINSLKPTEHSKLVITVDHLPKSYAKFIKESIENEMTPNINGHVVDHVKVKIF